jgi:hypothetical protein
MYVQDGQLEATLYLNNDTYYLEKAKPHFKHSVDFSHIVYRSSDLIFDFTGLFG